MGGREESKRECYGKKEKIKIKRGEGEQKLREKGGDRKDKYKIKRKKGRRK